MDKNSINPKRTLKVYGKAIAKPHSPTIINPEIRLTGKWVKEWGFNTDNGIIVTNVKEGVLIIRNGELLTPTIEL